MKNSVALGEFVLFPMQGCSVAAERSHIAQARIAGVLCPSDGMTQPDRGCNRCESETGFLMLREESLSRPPPGNAIPGNGIAA